MQISNSTNFSFINSQVINKNREYNKPISKFSIEETIEKSNYVSDENLQKEKHIGLITVYEDDKVLIQIANKNDTNASLEELEALGWLRQVTIFDKITKSLTIIDNIEMAENFYNNLTKFLEQHDLKIEDFIEYAKSKLLGNLFDLFLEEMGWKVSYQEIINEADINEETNSVIDGRWGNDLNMTMQTKISVLSDEEKLQVQPNYYQKIKANVFYENYVN